MNQNRLSPHRNEKPMPKMTLTKLKESILMKNTPVEAGRFAFFSPLPMFFVAMCWGMLFFFNIYLSIFPAESTPPVWVLILSLLPLLFSPLLGVLGIIHGIIKRKEKRAWLGILLSAFCLVENALLFCAMGYFKQEWFFYNPSKIVSNLEQLPNIILISVTLLVSKLDTSKLVKPLQL